LKFELSGVNRNQFEAANPFWFITQMLDTSLLDSALEEICSSDGISDELSDDMDLLGGTSLLNKILLGC